MYEELIKPYSFYSWQDLFRLFFCPSFVFCTTRMQSPIVIELNEKLVLWLRRRIETTLENRSFLFYFWRCKWLCLLLFIYGLHFFLQMNWLPGKQSFNENGKVTIVALSVFMDLRTFLRSYSLLLERLYWEYSPDGIWSNLITWISVNNFFFLSLGYLLRASFADAISSAIRKHRSSEIILEILHLNHSFSYPNDRIQVQQDRENKREMLNATGETLCFHLLRMSSQIESWAQRKRNHSAWFFNQ